MRSKPIQLLQVNLEWKNLESSTTMAWGEHDPTNNTNKKMYRDSDVSSQPKKIELVYFLVYIYIHVIKLWFPWENSFQRVIPPGRFNASWEQGRTLRRAKRFAVASVAVAVGLVLLL